MKRWVQKGLLRASNRWLSVTIVILALLSVVGVQGGNQHVDVLSSQIDSVVLNFKAEELCFDTMMVRGSAYVVPRMSGFSVSGEVGHPVQLAISKYLPVALCSNLRVQIIGVEYDTIEFDDQMLQWLPKQPPRRKTGKRDFRFVLDSAYYSGFNADDYSPVSVRPLGIARNQNLALVTFIPVHYNPKTKCAIVCKWLKCSLVLENVDVEATSRLQELHYSKAFSDVLPADGISTLRAKSVREGAPVRYMLVAHSIFRGLLDDFMAWKRRLGYKVDVVYVGDGGIPADTSTIAALIRRTYTDATPSSPAPTYLLLVGDHEQIPSFRSRLAWGGPSQIDNRYYTDLYYATWTPGDYLPDCFYGRLSAQTADELLPQLEKILMYEQYAFPDPSYLSSATLISGVDGGVDDEFDGGFSCCDPSMDYAALHYINAANRFSSVSYFKNLYTYAPSGVVVTGNSATAQSQVRMRTLFNQGQGWVNYSGHGEVQVWEGNPNANLPALTLNQAAQMGNRYKMSVMVANCCHTAKFHGRDCLGEVAMRRGDYAGAVGYIGASTYSYFDEDFVWTVGAREHLYGRMDLAYNPNNRGMYDALFHTHDEPLGKWNTSLGSMIHAGNYAVESMQESYLHQYYWEVYHLLGDPSLRPWLGQAKEMQVSCSPTKLSLGNSSLVVRAVPHAYVALTSSNGDSLVAAAYANEDGVAQLYFEPLNDTIVLELAISAQNYRPLFVPMYVVPSEEPYVVVSQLFPVSTVVSGDTIAFSCRLDNLGTRACDSVQVDLRVMGINGFVLGKPVLRTVGMAAHDSVWLDSCFAVWVLPVSADLSSLRLLVRSSAVGQTQVEQYFSFSVASANPRCEVVGVADRLLEDSTLLVRLSICNQGHDDLVMATQRFVSPDPSVQVDVDTSSIAFLSADSTVERMLRLHLLPTAPWGIRYPVLSRIEWANHCVVDTLWIRLGERGDDFSSSFSSYFWLRDTTGWVIDSTSFPGRICARSNTVSAGSAHNLSSELSIVWTSSVDDSISYWRRVSSERDFDVFSFAIDEEVQELRSGELDWQRVSFFVSAGTHRFTFKYAKDGTDDEGYDCAWIDDVVFPQSVINHSYVYDTICEGSLSVDYGEHHLSVANLAIGEWSLMDTVNQDVLHLYLVVVPRVEVRLMVEESEWYVYDEPVLLTAEGGLRYRWSNGFASDQQWVYPYSDTSFWVEGSMGSCVARDSVRIHIDPSTVEVKELDALTNISLWPNPVDERVAVQCDERIMKLEVYNLYGQCLHVLSPNSTFVQVDCSRLCAGIYMVRVLLEGGERCVCRMVKR